MQRVGKSVRARSCPHYPPLALLLLAVLLLPALCVANPNRSAHKAPRAYEELTTHGEFLTVFKGVGEGVQHSPTALSVLHLTRHAGCLRDMSSILDVLGLRNEHTRFTARFNLEAHVAAAIWKEQKE